MNHKWNIIMINTLIGRKKARNFIFIVLVGFGLHSCALEFLNDEPPDYLYAIYFKNATDDTLTLILGNHSLDYGQDELVLNAFDSIPYYEYSFGIDKGDEVMTKIFSAYRPLQDQARIYKKDSLVVNWYGPPREMHDSIHHFFNYNSWDHWLINRHKGRVRFTIYEEDVQ